MDIWNKYLVVYIDTVGPKEKYTEKLIQKFMHMKHDVKFIVSEKADSKYPVVSAASICAKVHHNFILGNQGYFT